MRFVSHRTMAAASRGPEDESVEGASHPVPTASGRYSDAEHVTRSRRRTYVQAVGSQFDRRMLR